MFRSIFITSCVRLKLEDVECFSMGMGVEWVFVRAVGFVEQGFGAGSPMDAGETDGATK